MEQAETSREIGCCNNEAVDHLVAGLLKGNSQAYAQLYEQFALAIQEFAERRLGDAELAEDVMVQTLVSAARHIRRFDPRISTFRAWLFGIARREIQQEARLRARRKLIPASAQVSLDNAAEEAAKGDLASDSAARLDAQHQIAQLEKRLSPLEMEVVILWSIHELSLWEIGQVVGRSERAINSILNRAKQKARELLASDERRR